MSKKTPIKNGGKKKPAMPSGQPPRKGEGGLEKPEREGVRPVKVTEGEKKKGKDFIRDLKKTFQKRKRKGSGHLGQKKGFFGSILPKKKAPLSSKGRTRPVARKKTKRKSKTTLTKNLTDSGSRPSQRKCGARKGCGEKDGGCGGYVPHKDCPLMGRHQSAREEEEFRGKKVVLPWRKQAKLAFKKSLPEDGTRDKKKKAQVSKKKKKEQKGKKGIKKGPINQKGKIGQKREKKQPRQGQKNRKKKTA